MKPTWIIVGAVGGFVVQRFVYSFAGELTGRHVNDLQNQLIAAAIGGAAGALASAVL